MRSIRWMGAGWNLGLICRFEEDSGGTEEVTVRRPEPGLTIVECLPVPLAERYRVLVRVIGVGGDASGGEFKEVADVLG